MHHGYKLAAGKQYFNKVFLKMPAEIILTKRGKELGTRASFLSHSCLMVTILAGSLTFESLIKIGLGKKFL